jgi:hypothetical protein
MCLSRAIGVEDELNQSVPVAKIDEDEPAVISAAVQPALNEHSLPDVFGPKLAAGMGASHRAIIRMPSWYEVPGVSPCLCRSMFLRSISPSS